MDPKKFTKMTGLTGRTTNGKKRVSGKSIRYAGYSTMRYAMSWLPEWIKDQTVIDNDVYEVERIINLWR